MTWNPTDEQLRKMMEKGWRAGLSEGTPCGQSSMLRYTDNIRAWLPDVCKRYGFKRVCDAGAGDLHWIKLVRWGSVEYKPFDVHILHPNVEAIDITKDLLPECDAVLCRMVLNHLDTGRVLKAVRNFQKVSRYLIATHFVGSNKNKSREFTRLDLSQWLGDPIEMIEDGHERNCRLALWELT